MLTRISLPQSPPVAAEDPTQEPLVSIMKGAVSSAGALLDSYNPTIDQHLTGAKALLADSKQALEQAETQLAKKQQEAQSVSDVISAADPQLNTRLAEARSTLQNRQDALQALHAIDGLDIKHDITESLRKRLVSAEKVVKELEAKLATTQEAITKRSSVQDALTQAAKEAVSAQKAVAHCETEAAMLSRQVDAYKILREITVGGVDAIFRLRGAIPDLRSVINGDKSGREEDLVEQDVNGQDHEDNGGQ